MSLPTDATGMRRPPLATHERELIGVSTWPTAAGSVSLDRALSIIEFLARQGAPCRLGEIVAQLGGPKATMHRILSTLCSRGYVRQNGESAYTLGLRWFEIGSKWAGSRELRGIARPHLCVLNASTRETVVLAVYEDGSVVYVEKLTSPQPVVATTELGSRCPATAVATGHILLAYQGADEITTQLRRAGGGQGAGPAGGDQLDNPSVELAGIRRQGFAVTRDTYRVGVSGVAAPVRDHTGRVVASVGLVLPSARFSTDRLDTLRGQTLECSAAITAELGGPRELAMPHCSTRVPTGAHS